MRCCGKNVSTEMQREKAVFHFRTAYTVAENGSGALSLEKLIHSNITLEILSSIGADNSEAFVSAGRDVITMELQGDDNTFVGYQAYSVFIRLRRTRRDAWAHEM